MEEAVLEREEEKVAEIGKLNTHTNILKNNAYQLLALSKNHATIKISSNTCEKVKESGVLYDGGLFSAATFAASAAVNEKNSFLIGANIDFLNPVKEEADIIFTADADVTSSGKKIVHVEGKIHDIVFMRGEFMLLKLDEKSLIK